MKKTAAKVIVVAIIVSVLIWLFYNIEPISRIPTLGFKIPVIPLLFLWLGLAITPLVMSFVSSEKSEKFEKHEHQEKSHLNGDFKMYDIPKEKE